MLTLIPQVSEDAIHEMKNSTPTDTDLSLDGRAMTLSPADRLRRARLAAGFRTAAGAARKFGWEQPAYRSHDNGARTFGRDRAEVYARAFSVSAAWLMALSENRDAFDTPTPVAELLAEATRAAEIADKLLPSVAILAELVQPSLAALYPDQSPPDDLILLAAAAQLRDLLLHAASDPSVASDPRTARSVAQFAARRTKPQVE